MQQGRIYQPSLIDENGQIKGDSTGKPIDDEALVAIGLIILVAFLAFLLVLMYCCLKFWNVKDSRRRRLSIRSTDIRYVQQIHKLMERQKEVEKMRVAGTKVVSKNEESRPPKPKPISQSPPRLALPPRSRSASPGTRSRSSRSSSNTDPQTIKKLAKLKEELEHYKIDHKIQVRRHQQPPSSSEGGTPLLGARKRTWEDLPNIEIDTDYVDIEAALSPSLKRIHLPNLVDVGVQTTNSLEREYPSSRKIFQTSFETTV
uniref:Uncharacterized protein n=1 Tax=Panagrolaimus sp. ES5 TaxID=591445 RepID=A0AC34FF42_9BILA